jgi:hypothetical protein
LHDVSRSPLGPQSVAASIPLQLAVAPQRHAEVIYILADLFISPRVARRSREPDWHIFREFLQAVAPLRGGAGVKNRGFDA